MLELCTLASGSSGNCLLVSDGHTHILVDAGISARRITRSLRELGLDPKELSGILITHEHSDHISGLATLTKQLSLPVYTSRGTGLQLCCRIAFLEDVLHTFRPGESFEVGGLGVESFPTPHDTVESVGYAVTGWRARLWSSRPWPRRGPAKSAVSTTSSAGTRTSCASSPTWGPTSGSW